MLFQLRSGQSEEARNWSLACNTSALKRDFSMPDVVSAEVRSRMMSGIHGTNTKPEIIVRTGLHSRGFRYRKNDKSLPGKPDLVFAKYQAVIFVNGCFWHGHNCHLFKWPSTRVDFWRKKIERNQEKDEESLCALHSAGWRVLTIWECALKGKEKLLFESVLDSASCWLEKDDGSCEILGGEGRKE